MSKHLTPARVCERAFGGPGGVAAVLGLGEKAPYNWHHPSTGRDAGDLPSARYMRALLARAAAVGVTLRPEWLIWGATEAEIAAEEARVAAMAAAHARVAEAGPPFTFPGGSRVEAAE